RTLERPRTRNSAMGRTATGMEAETVSPTFTERYTELAANSTPSTLPWTSPRTVSSRGIGASGTAGETGARAGEGSVIRGGGRSLYPPDRSLSSSGWLGRQTAGSPGAVVRVVLTPRLRPGGPAHAATWIAVPGRRGDLRDLPRRLRPGLRRVGEGPARADDVGRIEPLPTLGGARAGRARDSTAAFWTRDSPRTGGGQVGLPHRP